MWNIQILFVLYIPTHVFEDENVHFQVTDGTATDSEDITISVDNNIKRAVDAAVSSVTTSIIILGAVIAISVALSIPDSRRWS